METRFISSRELSASPGKVLGSLAKAVPSIITVNGKPAAVLVKTSEATMGRDLARLAVARLDDAIDAMRRTAALAGKPPSGMASIIANIAKIRNERREKE